MMTTLELYHHAVRSLTAAGISDPEVEAALLIAHLFGCKRSDIFLNGTRSVPDTVAGAVDQALVRRLAHEPLAYILGEQEFYGRVFTVTPDVLIPRPETELLVERAIHAARLMESSRPLRFLDLGTGSGVIAITLALEIPEAYVVGLDFSIPALRIAQANAIQLGASQVRWLNSDWGTSLRGECNFDLIATNPPYVAKRVESALQPELESEPSQALYGGEDGRRDIDMIMADAFRLLCPGGLLLMEIGFDQGEYVLARMNSLGQFDEIMVHQDYAGLPRILQARRKRSL
jgi:release factor glutamine methyltransferase